MVVQCVTVVLLLIQAVFGGEVLQDPVSQVQLWGQNATFVCSGKGEINNLFIAQNDGAAHTVGSNDGNDAKLNDNGVFWEGPSEGADIKTWTVTVLANNENNNTELWCRFKGSAPTAFTNHAFLTVVNDTPPASFSGLQVTFINSTLLSISYDKPWNHPINHYYVYVKNDTSDSTIVYEYNSDTTSFSLTQDAFHGFDTLEIFIIAHTDLGNSTSNVINTSFAKELPDTLEPVTVHINSNQVEVHFTVPEVSKYQSIKYSYTLIEVGAADNSEIYSGPYTELNAPIVEGIEGNTVYDLTITLWTEPGNGKSVITTVTFNTSTGSPQVTFVNSTLLTVSYAKLWDYPISHYHIYVKNDTSGSTTMFNSDTTSFSLTQDAFYSFDTLEIFVKAHTDLCTITSDIITTSFAKELPATLGPINIHVDMKRLQIGVNFTGPEVSKYHSIKYNYTLLCVDTEEIHHFGPYSQLNASIQGYVQDNKFYCLTITVWTEPGNGKFITGTAKFNTMTETPTSAPASANLTLILSVVGGVGGIILVLVAISVVLLVVFLMRVHKRLAIRIDAIEDTEKGRNHDSSCSGLAANNNKEKPVKLPKMMATNPIYDGSSPMYEYLPESRDLMMITRTSSLPGPSSLNLEIPPAVPPPRKMSMDSPGVKSGAQFSLDKAMTIQESVGQHPDNEEYVQMTSRCPPRYSKSPVLRIKREGMSEQLTLAKKDEDNKEKD